MEGKVIKDTRYCKVIKQGKITDNEYTYCIEKIFIKSMKRDEIRFSLYKDTFGVAEKYIPRSLDVTEKELLKLIQNAMKEGVFSKEFIKNLNEILNNK